MGKRRYTRLAAAIGLGLFLALVLVSIAAAYGEELIIFRDPYNGNMDPRTLVSTFHTDLTYVLALAAGFSINDSRTLVIWDQLVDSNQIELLNGTTYSNCLGNFPKPNPKMKKVCENQTEDNLFLPMWNKVPSTKNNASCVTSRFGPFAPFFHYPTRDVSNSDIDKLKAWGWNPDQELVGYQGYVWGEDRMIDFFGATCFYSETVTINIGIQPGSLEAFATYLHSLADSYSHQECRKATDALGWPWPYHTLYRSPQSIPQCDYEPFRFSNEDSHGREFGTNYPEDSKRTVDAAKAVYDELMNRSVAMEGMYQPLSYNTKIEGMPRSMTLTEAIETFVYEWNFDQPQERRAFADQLAAAILKMRVRVNR